MSALAEGTIGFLENRIAMAEVDLRIEREKTMPDFIRVAEATSRRDAAQLDLDWYNVFLDT